jgi:putative ABC transport system permease protein
MNLSTARSEKRAKEVGVRKAVGSGRQQLIGQFLSESILIAGMALVLALVIVLISLPYFNTLTEKTMAIEFGNPVFWGVTLVLPYSRACWRVVIRRFICRLSIPSRFSKGCSCRKKCFTAPKILVVVQFTFSIVLMIGTIIIYQQIQHGKNRPIGFTKQGLISVNSSKDLVDNFEALRTELLATGVVSSICKTNSPPTQWWSSNGGWEWKGSSPEDGSIVFHDHRHQLRLYQNNGHQTLKEGRDFSRDFVSDSTGVLLNEAAVKRMGLKHPGR